MYCVHLYGLHVYCALVHLDSSGPPGVRPTPGLTSSTQVVCVNMRAYTSTHTPTTLTPAKTEKYTDKTHISTPAKTQPPTPVTSANHEQAETNPTSNPPTHTHAIVKKHL